MTATVHTLPIWKNNSTAAEWLEELAAMAREFPQRWEKISVVFQETNEQGHAIKTRYFAHGNVCNSDVIGMLEEGKLHVYDYMRGRVE